MLNQKALDYIFDVNTKIDAKLSRLNQKNRSHRPRCSEAPPMVGAGTACLLAATLYALADDLERDGVDRPRRLDHRVYTAK